MKKRNLFILLTLFLVSMCISACEGSSNQNNDTDSSFESQGANEENASDDANNHDSNDNELNGNNNNNDTDKNNEKDAELTEDEAKEKVIDYIKENEPETAELLDSYQFSVKEDSDKYQVNMFSPESGDEDIGSPLLSSYEVDRTTGEVGEIEDESDETEPHLSEIGDLSEEERRAHHEELAVEPEYISDEVYKHLMLPGIHENTKEYEGRVNPGESVMLEFPDAEKAGDRTTHNPDVSEDGYFKVDVSHFEFEAGQNIRVYITNGYPHEQTFDLPVHEAKEGMEVLHVK